MDGKPLRLDPNATSAKRGKPAFLGRPADAPVYHGFPLIEETRTDGWCYGAISEYAVPDGCESGDGFVVAPDGSRAGLVWSVGAFNMRAILPPDKGRWGVYCIAFPKPVRNTSDLVDCFRSILPRLKELRGSIQRNT